jgi:hypothetical protein
LQAQQCTWLFKAKKFPIDNWRYDIHLLAPENDPLLIRPVDIPRNCYPTIFQFVTSYRSFLSNLGSLGNYFQKSQIFDNSLFRDTVSGRTIDINFFGLNFYNEHKICIRKLTFENCFILDRFKSIGKFSADGLPLTPALWLRLRGCILWSKNKFLTGGEAPKSVLEYVSRWKKGCKNIRNIFLINTVHDNPPLQSNSFNTFRNLVSCTPDETTHMKAWFSTWNISSLPNDFRNFIFCCRYNYLPTNNRLSSYIPEIDPRCPYCQYSTPPVDIRDSFLHCFLTCPSVRGPLSEVITKLNINITISDDLFSGLYWYGIFNPASLTKAARLPWYFFLTFFALLFLGTEDDSKSYAYTALWMSLRISLSAVITTVIFAKIFLERSQR